VNDPADDRGEPRVDSGGGAPKSAKRLSVWRDLMELDLRLYEQKKIRMLTPEARVLIHLRLHGSMSVKAAMQIAGTSDRGFYTVLERLRQAGVISTVKDDDDQRVRKLSIDPSAPTLP
jgi:DNA-binding MarR family transcriptional regulator